MSFHRRLLLLFILLGLLPAIAVCAVGLAASQNVTQALHQEHLGSIARNATASFKEILGLRVQKVRQLSDSWYMRDYLRNGDAISLRTAFHLYVDTLGAFDDVVLLDADGQVLVGYRNETTGLPLSGEDYFAAAQEDLLSEHVFVSKVHTALNSEATPDARHLALSMPFWHADGTLQYVLVAFVDADTVSSFIQNISFGQTGVGFLMDVDNYILSHPEARFYHAYTASSNLDGLVKRWEAGGIPATGLVEDALDGTRRIYYYEILPDLKMAFCLRQDASEFAAAQQRMARFLLGALLLAGIVLAVPFAVWLRRFSMRPAEQFQKTLLAGQKTDEYALLDTSPKSGSPELAEAYNSLVKKMHGYQETLRRERRHAAYLSLHDPATGLLNHSAFEQELSSAIWAGQPFGLMYLSLYELRQKSYMLGSDAMDSVLSITGRRIEDSPFGFQLAASMNMGEFAFIKYGTQTEVRQAATLFLEMLSMPFELEGSTFRFESNMGIAFFPQDGMVASELIANANIAMLQAESTKDRALLTYRQEMRGQISRSRSILDVLYNCADSGELLWLYQPIFDTSSQQIIGFETKMRIKSEKLGLMSPREFLPIAETDPRLMEMLGTLALNASCAFAQKLSAHHFSGFVSVNLYPAQFQYEPFMPRLMDMLHSHGLAPERIRLEVEERVLKAMKSEQIKQLRGLHENGVQVMLDHVHTIRSSMDQIMDMPLDIIKFTPSFFYHGDDSPHAKEFNSTLLKLIRGAGFDVMAENANTPQDVALVESLGCHILQGQALCIPLTEDKAIERLVSPWPPKDGKI